MFKHFFSVLNSEQFIRCILPFKFIQHTEKCILTMATRKTQKICVFEQQQQNIKLQSNTYSQIHLHCTQSEVCWHTKIRKFPFNFSNNSSGNVSEHFIFRFASILFRFGVQSQIFKLNICEWMCKQNAWHLNNAYSDNNGRSEKKIESTKTKRKNQVCEK